MSGNPQIYIYIHIIVYINMYYNIITINSTIVHQVMNQPVAKHRGHGGLTLLHETFIEKMAGLLNRFEKPAWNNNNSDNNNIQKC